MSEEVLLDLCFLTEEERDIINEVILKDVQMRKLEQSRISRLRKELGELKEDGLPEEELDEKNDRYCARCQTYFGILWNKGALCPRCEQKVCKTCRENVAEEGWMCTLCLKVREVKAQSGAWFFQAQKQKDDKLFGSLLLRKSLRSLPGSENRSASKQTVFNHKPICNTDKIHADQQNQNKSNFDERTPNSQAEEPLRTSNNIESRGEQYSDISDEDLSDEESYNETFSPREDSEKSSSKGESDSSESLESDHEDLTRRMPYRYSQESTEVVKKTEVVQNVPQQTGVRKDDDKAGTPKDTRDVDGQSGTRKGSRDRLRIASDISYTPLPKFSIPNKRRHYSEGDTSLVTPRGLGTRGGSIETDSAGHLLRGGSVFPATAEVDTMHHHTLEKHDTFTVPEDDDTVGMERFIETDRNSENVVIDDDAEIVKETTGTARDTHVGDMPRVPGDARVAQVETPEVNSEVFKDRNSNSVDTAEKNIETSERHPSDIRETSERHPTAKDGDLEAFEELSRANQDLFNFPVSQNIHTVIYSLTKQKPRVEEESGQEREMIGQEREMIGQKREMIGQEREIVGQEREIVGQEREMIGQEREMIGQESEIVVESSREDVFGEQGAAKQSEESQVSHNRDVTVLVQVPDDEIISGNSGLQEDQEGSCEELPVLARVKNWERKSTGDGFEKTFHPPRFSSKTADQAVLPSLSNVGLQGDVNSAAEENVKAGLSLDNRAPFTFGERGGEVVSGGGIQSDDVEVEVGADMKIEDEDRVENTVLDNNGEAQSSEPEKHAGNGIPEPEPADDTSDSGNEITSVEISECPLETIGQDKTTSDIPSGFDATSETLGDRALNELDLSVPPDAHVELEHVTRDQDDVTTGETADDPPKIRLSSEEETHSVEFLSQSVPRDERSSEPNEGGGINFEYSFKLSDVDHDSTNIDSNVAEQISKNASSLLPSDTFIDNEASRVYSDDETEPGDKSSRKEADEYETRPGDESSNWKAEEYEESPGNESSNWKADEYETRPGDESSNWKADEYETRPGDESSNWKADEYETRPGDESPSGKREEDETRSGDESSMKEADEYEARPGDESSNWKADDYEESPGDESSNWKADEYETRPGDESSNWQAEEHEVRPDYEDTQAGDPQSVGYQAAHVHQDVSGDHDISATVTINSEVPSTTDEPSPLDSRENDLLAFSQALASSVLENQGTRPSRDDLPGSRVTDYGDDRRRSDPRHEAHGSFYADDESSISETSGYVTPIPSEDTSSKRTPSISGDEGARKPREEYQRETQEGPPPVIITTGSGEGSRQSNRSSFADYDDDLDVSFSKYEGGLGNRMLKDQLSMGSRESIMSYYSNAGGDVYGKYPVTGDIYFGIKYDAISQLFQIQIHQARDIAAVDEKNTVSDPYVKTYLLPDRSRGGKRKSKVKKNTINPVFDEIITYKVSYDEILQRTLWLTVWNYDRFGHNDFLGEVILPIDQYQQSGFSLEEPEPQWYHLCERQAEEEPMMSYNGEIVVALKYVSPSELVTKKKKKKKRGEEEKGELHVNIVEANDLLAKDANGFSDPFCKSYLLPDKSKKTKQKTAVIKKSLNPKWNYRFVYGNVTQEELMDKVLELTVWDFDRGSSNDFLGGARLGLGAGLHEWDDSNSEEQAAWNKMLNNQNEWNQVTLTLRDNMGNHNSAQELNKTKKNVA